LPISWAIRFIDSANSRWPALLVDQHPFLIASICRSSIFLTAAVFLSAPRMNWYCCSSPIFRACCAFLMKSFENSPAAGSILDRAEALPDLHLRSMRRSSCS